MVCSKVSSGTSKNSDTLGKILGFRNVGYSTSITEYNYEIKNDSSLDIFYSKISRLINNLK